MKAELKVTHVADQNNFPLALGLEKKESDRIAGKVFKEYQRDEREDLVHLIARLSEDVQTPNELVFITFCVMKCQEFYSQGQSHLDQMLRQMMGGHEA